MKIFTIVGSRPQFISKKENTICSNIYGDGKASEKILPHLVGEI
ncbi:hypothetical protein [Schinkia azotoformans]|nr:hypothetical protein [Schinkia azotoformans]MEC1719150.1 hypothetical protein [Schinkia azotoformans]MED4413802.1 hypothetical protein [Schinkia azotoformans]